MELFFNNPFVCQWLVDFIVLLEEFIKARDSQALVDLCLSTSNKTMDFQMRFARFALLHEAVHILLPQTLSIGPENGLNHRRKILSMVKQVI